MDYQRAYPAPFALEIPLSVVFPVVFPSVRVVPFDADPGPGLTTHRADVSAKASKTAQRFHPAIVFRSFSRRHFEKSTFFGATLLLLLQRKPSKRARASKATTPLTNKSLKNVSQKRKRRNDAKNREKCGHFHGRRREETL